MGVFDEVDPSERRAKAGPSETPEARSERNRRAQEARKAKIAALGLSPYSLTLPKSLMREFDENCRAKGVTRTAVIKVLIERANAEVAGE